MKTLLVSLSFIFFGISNTYAQDNPLDRSNSTLDQFEEARKSFSNGEATNGEQYYEGVLAEVLLVEAYLLLFVPLDEENAPLEEFNEALRGGLAQIESARTTLKLYKKESWPLRSEMHDKTISWLSAVEGLMTNHLKELAEPLSRADETWDDEEFDLYEAYLTAYDEYLKVDEAWVEYQYIYAKANDFVIEGTVDLDTWDESEPKDSNEK